MEDKNKLIAEAEALASLDGNEGWAIVKQHLETIMELSKEALTSRKKIKGMNDVIWYQAKYDNAAKILAIIDTKKRKGLQAKEAADGQTS